MTQAPDELHALLQRLHRELAHAPRLDAEERILLEQVARDVRDALDAKPRGPTPAAGIDLGADVGADLGAAARVGGAPLEAAAARFEAEHPQLAHVVRTLAETLARVGL